MTLILPSLWNSGEQVFFWKGPDSKYFRFAAQLISSTATPLCQCDEKAAVMIRKHTSVAV